MSDRVEFSRRCRRSSSEDAGTSLGHKERRKRSSKPVKERWLLTRKTWRYMADAGRRLIPDGANNKTEDIPKIEQYFQDVCQKEPKFLLWRKASYPGTLAFRSHRRRRLIKGGSCRAKASSADEADNFREPTSHGFFMRHSPGGKFDLTKIKSEWLSSFDSRHAHGSSSVTPRKSWEHDEAESEVLADMLQKYLNIQEKYPEAASLKYKLTDFDTAEKSNYKNLISKLQKYLDSIMAHGSHENDTYKYYPSNSSLQQPLIETLRRYYNRSSNTDHVISNILTDRKLLEKLYFNLRYTKGFRGSRPVGIHTASSSKNFQSSLWKFDRSTDQDKTGAAPPLIAVQKPSTDKNLVDDGVQTDAVPKFVIDFLIVDMEREKAEYLKDLRKCSNVRRKSSVDNDDVSPSVSDTIKRYLRMARKKSIDSDKPDRFKRVNYDRNLLNIKAKENVGYPGENSGNEKSCQTEDNWFINFREMATLEPGETLSDFETTSSPASRNVSSRSSIDAGLESEEATTPKHHQSFLSHFLYVSHKDKPHSAPGSPALNTASNSTSGIGMQKSKSSSSVVYHSSKLVSKKNWKSRSKSNTKLVNQPSTWTPQGKCIWAGTNGRRVALQETRLRTLSEIERQVLCRVAVAKLQSLNLGVHIRPPSDTFRSGLAASKPKKRAYLLKKKSITTSLFEHKTKDEKVKDKNLVFGIPISQCLENDRLAKLTTRESFSEENLTKSDRLGSRTSITSLSEASKNVLSKIKKGESCDSLSSKSRFMQESDLESENSTQIEWDVVPCIVHQCINHLKITGLRTLGLFRVSPSKKRVRQLRENFDCGRETEIGLDNCPHDVAALLKEYFRDLPDPLLSRDLYQAFVHTQKIRNRRQQQEALQHLVQLLPRPNQETLWVLLNFLNEVAANSEDKKDENGKWVLGNKMDATNLATVFAPNILHCVKPGQARSEVSVERAEERIDVINVVRALLEQVPTLFTVPAALLDEVYLQMMDSDPAELDVALCRRNKDFNVETDVESQGETVLKDDITSSTIGLRKVLSEGQSLHQSDGIGGEFGARSRRPKRSSSRRREDSRNNSVDSASSEDPTDKRRQSSPMIITASLTIPMSGTVIPNEDDLNVRSIDSRSKYFPLEKHKQRTTFAVYNKDEKHESDSPLEIVTNPALSSTTSCASSSSPTSPESTAVSSFPKQRFFMEKESYSNFNDIDQFAPSSSELALSRATTSAPYNASITSIGSAVLRSKTADIEKMLQIGRPERKSVSQSLSTKNEKDNNRLPTDISHSTRLSSDPRSLDSSSLTSSTSSKKQNQTTTPHVWKRREIISSNTKNE